MSTRDEIEREIDEFERAVVAAERLAARDPREYRTSGRQAYESARARLLALIGPPAPPAAPSEREIEAAVALMKEEGFFERIPFATDADEDAHYRSRAEWVLVAAAAARAQAEGEG